MLGPNNDQLVWEEEEEEEEAEEGADTPQVEGGRGRSRPSLHRRQRRRRSLLVLFFIIVVFVVVIVVILIVLCVSDNISRMYARRVVDAARLEREHPWRGGDEGKRGRRRAWEGRERNDLGE